MKKLVLTTTGILMFGVSGISNATMSSFLTYSGEGAAISVDAVGMGDNQTAQIKAEIAAGATIQYAYLYSASVWSNGLSDVSFGGTTFFSDTSSRLDVGDKNANSASENRWDVTTIVQNAYDGNGGEYSFDVKEFGYLDGEILAVVYGVDGEDVKTAMLFDGELATTGDNFYVNLAEDYDGSDAIMSLGISYSYQASSGQYSQIDINGNRLTSSAGGEDDGFSSNGGLITAGGVGDSILNPPDPESIGDSPTYDDELYNLASFLTIGDNSINISSLNPSNDDNVFFMALSVTGEAYVTDDPIGPTVPEPTTMLLFATGLAGLAGVRRRNIR